ncbi:MAG: tripartite tricarboxylate transporter substrate binding protein [Roseococcus sp.]|nr:tripartite tricarboxylate transporter substrate binding protein [Roseococcus sp.]
MQAKRRALVMLPLAAPALAQDRPLRLIVPYPPGGPTDLVARTLAAALQPPALVENRPGASGLIGAGDVARLRGETQTLLVNASAHVIVPHLQRQMPFDAIADFTPVTEVVKVPLVLVVNPSLPARDLPGLLAQARANPGRLSYASSSIGGAPHLAGELFKLLAGVDLVHVPYRGSGPALSDLIAGHVQMMFDSLASSAQHVREGRLRALAVTTAGRLPALPDVPTMAEAGVPGYEITTWYGVWGPPGMGPEVARRHHLALLRAGRSGAAQAAWDAMGAIPVFSEPSGFAAFLREEHARFGRLIRDANIQPE